MPWVSDDNVAAFVDLYELTMAASYFAHGMNEPATFELSVRQLPEHRGFLVACGLEDALAYLDGLAFSDDTLAYVRSLDTFDEAFLDFLARLRFTGDVWAVPEGETVFANEPLLRVTAPLIEAQLAETFLLNALTFQTMIATKAARIALACSDRTFVDFSGRRDHGADAALRVARAAFVGGASGTSNVLAGQLYGLDLSGTMAHSYVLSFPDETEAFRAYALDFPESTVLLIDTYDTVEGARRAAAVANELRAEGVTIRAVRLDSGDLAALARTVRNVLDEAGCGDIRIFASSDLDEYRIAELLAGGAPIDAFGVGTRLGTSADAPSLGGVYKLVAGPRGPVMKRSAGKGSLPGVKQVYREERGGGSVADAIALADEPRIPGRPLLAQVMTSGKRLSPPEPLATLRERRAHAVARLPEAARNLHASANVYPVRLSGGLTNLVRQLGG
ncbi:MAG: nicotinate phosphoribosyltransferase [Dehalococcoidia bacterium]|nr:nicotinate phosphoribosyltransferase [Dehalococcoidia bacterium]MYD29407.1 nicotinate phosphoribosyltransferase [Dehalococcoidia bacterium]